MERPTASQILRHQFFDDIRNEVEAELNESKSLPLPVIPEDADREILDLHSMLKGLEKKLNDKYLEFNDQLSENMRSILVDWLVDVTVHFDLSDETLHLAITYIDMVLEKKLINKSQLQLIGVTCMKIADLFNERSREYYKQESIEEYTYITADEYKQEELLECEKEILGMLDFKLIVPTAVNFLKIYADLLEIPENICHLALYITDMTLINYNMLSYSASTKALASLVIACKSMDYKVDETLFLNYKQMMCQCTESELDGVVSSILNYWSSLHTFNISFQSINNKHKNLFDEIPPPNIMIRDIRNWLC